MSFLNKLVRSLFFIGMLCISATVLSETKTPASLDNTPLEDGQLSKEELAQILTTAQAQLVRLTERATEEYEGRLLDEEPNMPAAWMLMKDGKSIKRVKLGGKEEDVPASARIYMFRVALKAIAQSGEINAGAILYTGRVNEQSEARALVIEHEHRLGVSANKVIGFSVDQNEVSYGKPATQKKPFEWFYEQKNKTEASGS